MKRTGLNIICSLLLAGGMCACTATPKQTEEIKWSERMAQSEMQRFPEPWMIEKAKKPRWGYTHGLVVKSMLEEWKHTGDTAYYNYAKIYADSLIDTDGKIKTMKYLSFNIDNINVYRAGHVFACVGISSETVFRGENGYYIELVFQQNVQQMLVSYHSCMIGEYGNSFIF